VSSTVPWQTLKEYEEILYQFHEACQDQHQPAGSAQCLTPLTVMELSDAMELSRQNSGYRP